MISDFYKDYNPNHSDYQIKNFIIYKHGKTPYGQYRQSLREIFPRFKSILDSIIKIEELAEELDIYKNDGTTKRKEKISRLKLDKKIIELKMAKDGLQRLINEFKKFYSIACQLKNELGELTEEKLNKLDAEFWEVTFKEKIAVEFIQ